jgi:hypothetical protein
VERKQILCEYKTVIQFYQGSKPSLQVTRRFNIWISEVNARHFRTQCKTFQNSMQDISELNVRQVIIM